MLVALFALGSVVTVLLLREVTARAMRRAAILQEENKRLASANLSLSAKISELWVVVSKLSTVPIDPAPIDDPTALEEWLERD